MLIGDSSVPILLLVFNRPFTTGKVFESIKKAKPQKLYIAQDGPRHEKDVLLINAVRDVLVIDRDCDVKYLYREKNLGCFDAVAGGINRFFEHEEFGIILEDDCVMGEAFPWFCHEINRLYGKNTKIATISGSNYDRTHVHDEYFFTSHHPLLWGWATWRDRRSEFTNNTTNNETKKSLQRYSEGGYRDSKRYSVMRQNKRYTIVPGSNMIMNIGYIGIHNQRAGSFHNIPIGYQDINIGRPIIKKEIISNTSYDKFMEKFILKLYLYTRIEIVLKKLKLYNIIHKLFIYFIILLQKLGLK